ncbi:MAG: ThiF family adenylyltransferase [Candidatus Hodarchaeota archaeon]
MLEEKQVSDFPIVIRLRKLPDVVGPFGYQSPEGIRYDVTAERFLDGVRKSIKIKIVELVKDLSSRRKGLLETDLLTDSSVVIIGLGTGGIQIALELAKAGIGKFQLVDPDRLEIGNVSRHQAGVSFVGRKKVVAAKDLILEKNPMAKADAHAIKANADNEELLTSLIRNSDLIICATDNRQSKLFINSLCVKAKKPVIFAGAFRRAYGGHVIRVRPTESACFHCFVLAMPDKEADQEISSEEEAENIAYSDMPVQVEPGLSLDVAPIGIMASKLALQELIKGKESSLHILDKDFEANWYFWVNRPEPNTDYATFPPLSESSDEMTILRWYGVYLEKEPGCPTCGDFDKALREQYGLEPNTVKPPTRSSLPRGIKT